MEEVNIVEVTIPVSVRVSADLHAKLSQRAVKDRRSIAETVRIALETFLEEKEAA